MAILPSFKVQDIVDLFKKGATIEAQEKIMKFREAALQLQEENLKLKEKIRELEQQQEIKDSLVWDGSVYWRQTGNQREGPYCPTCYDSNSKHIRLQEHQDVADPDWFCGVCKGFFDKK